MSTIFEPANLIINILFVPRFIYFCAFFAYDGLKNGVTLTHSGIKKGLIARIYGSLYLLVCVFQLMIVPSLSRELLAIDPEDLKQALTLSISSSEIGLMFLGLGLVFFLIREGAITLGTRKSRRTTRNIRRVQAGRSFTNWMIAMIVAIGIPPLLGLPHFFTVAVFVFFTYFAPFTSPIAVKKLMSMPIDENKLPQKSVSPV
ncbi:MAG: hypothetical protein EHM40_04935 [Chloroflexi bacterium]|nr:MAG: hypothetical protein EHM40_04935 [Chloroflexota bacterium]